MLSRLRISHFLFYFDIAKLPQIVCYSNCISIYFIVNGICKTLIINCCYSVNIVMYFFIVVMYYFGLV